MEQFVKAVEGGSRAGSIVTFNGLSVTHDEKIPLSDCISRDSRRVSSPTKTEICYF